MMTTRQVSGGRGSACRPAVEKRAVTDDLPIRIAHLAVPRRGSKMTLNAANSGSFKIAGDLEVHRLGYGAMRITGEGIWGEPRDRAECLRKLKRLPELGI